MAVFTLNYTGGSASEAELEFYDASRALIAFQRSLALTTHLVMNGEIITQAPSLKNAKIMVRPPREGSWEVAATIIFSIVAGMAVAPKDSVAGHLARSIYDYALKSLLGIDVDFEKTIRSQVQQLPGNVEITEAKLDSLAEKIEPAVIDLHRPIVWSGSAMQARIQFGGDKEETVGPRLNSETYEYVTRTIEVKSPETFLGVISSYNSNTYRGRAFLPELQRPIPFELSPEARSKSFVKQVTESLSINATDRSNVSAQINLRAFRRESAKGRLKALWVIDVQPNLFDL
jgi:hypothetical protein